MEFRTRAVLHEYRLHSDREIFWGRTSLGRPNTLSVVPDPLHRFFSHENAHTTKSLGDNRARRVTPASILGCSIPERFESKLFADLVDHMNDR